MFGWNFLMMHQPFSYLLKSGATCKCCWIFIWWCKLLFSHWLLCRSIILVKRIGENKKPSLEHMSSFKFKLLDKLNIKEKNHFKGKCSLLNKWSQSNWTFIWLKMNFHLYLMPYKKKKTQNGNVKLQNSQKEMQGKLIMTLS